MKIKDVIAMLEDAENEHGNIELELRDRHGNRIREAMVSEGYGTEVGEYLHLEDFA